jgi:hypothetical protein
MEENRAYSVDDELMHYAKGQRARNHKYVAIRNGRYIYPDDVSGAYQGITNAARRGINTVESVQRRAGESLNSFLNGVNDNRHEKEAARQQRIQSALDEATKKAAARKKKKQKEEKDAFESIMDPFRRVENRRKQVVRTYKNEIEKPIANELDRQKKVHTQLKKERQEKITNVKNTLDNLPSTVKKTAKNELDWWRSPTRQKGQQAIQKISASDFIAENEKRARQAAAKKNTSSQRSSAMKEKSSSAHNRAQAKRRSAAKNKQRIANAKASRAR